MPLRVKAGIDIPIAPAANTELLLGFSRKLAVTPELPEEVETLSGQPHDRLGLRTLPQERELWCWAACTEMVLRFFEAPFGMCNVAGGLLNRNCCNSATPGCNVGLSIEEVDQAFGSVRLAGVRFDREISFEDIQNQISGNPRRPVVAGIKWAGDGGHLVVISGWRIDNASRRFVTVNDPFYSSGDIRYEDLVSQYGRNNTGRWEHTWTNFTRV